MRFRSGLERECYTVLLAMYPHHQIDHDYPIGGGLKLDFLVRATTPFAVEVDGPQHTQYNPHFHKSPADLQDQIRRDRKKEQTCKELGIAVVRLQGAAEINAETINNRLQEALEVLGDTETATETQRYKNRKSYRNNSKEMRRRRNRERYQWAKARRRGMN